MVKIDWLPASVHNLGDSPKPFHTFLLKVAARCNIDCDYCYVYQGADQSWRRRPKFMSQQVARATFSRIAEHVDSHNLNDIAITFHGGEPLLAGVERLSHYIRAAKEVIPCSITFSMQTNAILFDKQILDLFARENVRFGISVDGNRKMNDRHRLYRNGQSSFPEVFRALELIQSNPEWEQLFGGFLAVIDLENDPAEVYHALTNLGGRSFDLLFPDHHHSNPPPRPIADTDQIAYGQWMVGLFDVWASSPLEIEVRYFDEIIAMICGQDSTMEAIGAKNVDLIVVESDGEIEAVDTLKVVGEEATSTGKNVFDHSFDNAWEVASIRSRMIGYDALCSTCSSCEILDYCGGGYVSHRYSEDRGFINPSVYCNDIQYLVKHVKGRVEHFLY